MLKTAAVMMMMGAIAQAAERVPELGLVKWSRGFEAAAARAKAEGKPLAVLFDEVPGCSTVVGFGQTVLSHPLVADALEHELVPVLVQNNVSGDDRRVLERFKEPAWNNPVLRLFDASGREVTRLDTPSLAQVVDGLVRALEASSRPVPGYLRVLADEQVARKATRTFEMGCFWEGEAKLGAVDGVVSSQPGFVGGSEVVQLVVDERKADALATFAKQRGYREVESKAFRASASDDKYQLKESPLRRVPMTRLQKSRLNAQPGAAQAVLSPRQLEVLSRGSGPDVLEEDDVVKAYALSRAR